LFDRFFGPFAPPTANVPTPVSSLIQDTSQLKAHSLRQKMHLQGLHAPSHRLDALAYAVEECFQSWQFATMVTHVLGSGQVQGFNPPFVQCGTVVGGTAFMPPGGFL
jgi:hypothetical protein